MATSGTHISAVRAFNRFYTSVIGVLQEGLLDTPYSLTEARVIFELAQQPATDVADVRRRLDLDAGYLSRMLARFESDGLITRQQSSSDGRRQVIRLTREGRRAFRMLDERSTEQVRSLLSALSGKDQDRLVGAMNTMQQILGDRSRPARPLVLRSPGPGDFGWVVHRHGVLYAQEYGWNESFEGLVARIVADYAERHDAQREAAWIAEVVGEPVGCIFCVKKDERVARLRLLLVEPSMRGMGIGTRLVDECIQFARRVGYAQLTLWTNDVLTDARRIYERYGFELIEEEKHHSFGRDLVGQSWSLDL